MRRKYKITGLVIIFSITVVYFGNIIFAITIHSENIDKHTLGIMLQGRLNPTKEINLMINKSSYNIPLPNGSGEFNKNEYLVPTTSWKSYRDTLRKAEWDYLDQIGTLIRVKNKAGDEFNISIRPFTGAYQILNYSSVNK